MAPRPSGTRGIQIGARFADDLGASLVGRLRMVALGWAFIFVGVLVSHYQIRWLSCCLESEYVPAGGVDTAAKTRASQCTLAERAGQLR